MKLWGGRFSKSTSDLVDKYCSSIGFDYKLADYDIQGSIAHVKMLAKIKALDNDVVEKIINGLKQIQIKISNNEVVFRQEDEDIHMNIERLLYEQIGEDAGKLHTGRSRNDQVALDLHLYLREQTLTAIEKLVFLNNTLLELAKNNIDVILPGYTHLQRAEPVRLAHHFLAYLNMFSRDIDRMLANFESSNISPLGAGALAGSGFAVDSDYSASLLNIDKVYQNSLDAVADRDFVAEFLFNSSMIMMHISKLSEELILWSSQEFNFIEIDDQFCTGSSMMPQKKNPDVAEVARGKTGRVYGSLFGLLTTLKGLPLAYNKDMQEDKEGVFDTVDTINDTLDIFPQMLASMNIKKDNMFKATEYGFLNATQLANYLVNKGVAFRDAHYVSGSVVKYCIGENIKISDLSIEKLQEFNSVIRDDVYKTLDIENVVEEHCTKLGTAKKSVVGQIEFARTKLERYKSELSNKKSLLDMLD